MFIKETNILRQYLLICLGNNTDTEGGTTSDAGGGGRYIEKDGEAEDGGQKAGASQVTLKV